MVVAYDLSVSFALDGRAYGLGDAGGGDGGGGGGSGCGVRDDPLLNWQRPKSSGRACAKPLRLPAVGHSVWFALDVTCGLTEDSDCGSGGVYGVGNTPFFNRRLSKSDRRASPSCAWL